MLAEDFGALVDALVLEARLPHGRVVHYSGQCVLERALSAVYYLGGVVMGRINWTKVEEALEKGLREMEVEYLNERAKARAEGRPDPQDSGQQHQDRVARSRAMLSLVTYLRKYDKTLYSQLSISKEKLFQLLKKPLELSESEWSYLEEIHEEAEVIKAKMLEDRGVTNDQNLVDKERKKHINKRFNVRGKWLPLK